MKKLTPMMEQYFEIKKEYEHCLLFFRLGDFYELFYDDAIVASKELEITLTKRDCGESGKAPMCGVPYHAVDGYIARLIEKDYRVAICEQVEDPKQTKGIVKREVVRVITPGTIMDERMLEEGRNNYILCLYQDGAGYGFSFADITTGEFFTAEMLNKTEKELIDEIAKLSPKEIIVNEASDKIERIFNIRPTISPAWTFAYANAVKHLCDHFEVLNLNGYGLDGKKHAIIAAGALLQYLLETQKNLLKHILSINYYTSDRFMTLDISSRRNLELTETIREKNKKGSLLWVLDNTKTAMGARLLRKWVEQPLVLPEDINRRLDMVEELVNDPLLREELKEFLSAIYDFERLMSKLAYKTANAQDLIKLKKSFLHFPHIKTLLKNFRSALAVEMYNAFDELQDIWGWVEVAICEEPPFSLREGGFIKDGFNANLDKLRQAKNEGANWLSDLEKQEKESTGIKSLKVRFNRVFGYYIEVTNSYRNLVPGHYVRRQTLANCERYTTEGLKEIEEVILGADEKIKVLEYDLFSALREQIAGEVQRVQLSSYIIATLDVLQSFADVSDKNHYTKPRLTTNGIIQIFDGRHPVVEKMLNQTFIPNDTYLDSREDRVNIITGPNMAGKSTYMRQNALIVLMAQIGCFIPASEGSISVVDRIFTRVGASDDLSTGQSTFMIEMSEVANILHNATERSLIILDEIGRGTSTYDGLSIAWAVVEHIAANIRAKTLFSTHYQEITELEGKVEGVKNYCVTVQQRGEDIIFLRKIARGGSDNSYGVYVAKLAGVPFSVLNRSNEILGALKQADIMASSSAKDDAGEATYSNIKRYDYNKHRITIEELE